MTHFPKVTALCLSLLVAAPLVAQMNNQIIDATAALARFQRRATASHKIKTPPMPLVAPLFVENAEFTSTIVLVNPSMSSASARVTLRNLRGNKIADKAVAVPAAGRLDVSIGEMLQSISSSETGSVVVQRDGQNLAAALSLTDRRQTKPSYVDEELAMPMQTSSPMLRAVADDAKGSPLVAITSMAAMPQHVTIRCLPEHGAPVTRVIDLEPDATVLSRVCVADSAAAHDFRSLTLAQDDTSGGAFGIELTSDGAAGGFAAFGLAQHRDGGDKYFSTAPFEDPMVKKSTTTVFTGVPVGHASLLPSGPYTPLLALANFGKEVAIATITLATTTGENPASQTVATLRVDPGQSKLVKLRGLSGNARMQNSFLVKSSVAPGELFVKLAAISDGPLQEVELLGKDAENGFNGGAHPWTIADGDDSTLILFNDSPNPQNFHVTIGYDNGKLWQKRYTLKPMETSAISIGDLIEAQIKDDHGNKLPSALTQGDVLWNTSVNAGQGRVLQSNAATAMARSFSCYAWYFVCGIDVNGPTTVLVGATFSESVPDYQVCVDTDEQNFCFNDYSTGANLDLSYSWTNSNSSILQQNDPGFDSTFNLTALAGGQATVTVQASDGTCSVSSGTQITVRKPTATSIVGSTYSGFYSCGSGTATGHERDVWEQIVDQSAVPFTDDGVTVGETISPTSRDDFQWGNGIQTGSGPTQYQNAPGATPLHGVIEDRLFNCDVIINRCTNGTGNGLQSTLMQQDTYNSISLTNQNTLIEVCTGFLVNGQ